MKYFKLGYSLKGIGCFPQSQKMTKGYIYRGTKNSVYNIGHDFNVVPNLKSIQLESKAKLTDCISCVVINSNIAQLFSKRLTDFLLQFELPSYQLHQASVIGRNIERLDYHLFMVTENSSVQIDFERSVFVIRSLDKNANLVFHLHEINSYEEYINTISRKNEVLKRREKLRPLRLFFREDMKYDLFRFDRLGGYRVNEKLKNAIEAEKFTGIQFKKADLFDP